MTADRLVIGTAQLAQPYGVANRSGPPDHDSALAILRMAADAAVAAFDTAPGYGRAEEIIGQARVTVPVFTKFAPGVDPKTSVAQSLSRLRREWVDLVLLHDPDVRRQDADGTLAQAHALVGMRVGSLGASIYTPDQAEWALADARINAVQGPLSLADRRMTAMAAAAGRAGKSFYARSVFLQGALLMDATNLPEWLQSVAPVLDVADEIARRDGWTRQEVLTTFVRDTPGVTAIVIGAETPGQLAEILSAMTRPPLDEDDRNRLKSLPELNDSVIDPRQWPMKP